MSNYSKNSLLVCMNKTLLKVLLIHPLITPQHLNKGSA